MNADLSELDDDLEVQNMLAVTPEEVEFKTLMWIDENQEWLANQEAKRLIKAEKHSQHKTKTRSIKKQKREQKSLPYANTPSEAAKNLVSSKKTLSKKINYKVLDNLVCIYSC